MEKLFSDTGYFKKPVEINRGRIIKLILSQYVRKSDNFFNIAYVFLDNEYCGSTPDIIIDADLCTDMFSLQNHNETIFITVCDQMTKQWQLPLLIGTTLMIFLLILGCLPIYILQYILDPVGMLQVSRYCFPACLFDNIWPEDQKALLPQVLHFLHRPSKQTLEESNEILISKTDQDMMHWSIKHGYVRIIEKMLEPSVNEQISTSVLKKAINEGEAKVIKTLAIKAFKQENPELDQVNLYGLIYILPDKRGIHTRLGLGAESWFVVASYEGLFWQKHSLLQQTMTAPRPQRYCFAKPNTYPNTTCFTL